MNLLSTLAAFALALGTLIVFHEFGHYFVARLCGVRVLRFSLGFGRPVWSRRLGRDGTEWAIGAFPLGGYVKMLDEREVRSRRRNSIARSIDRTSGGGRPSWQPGRSRISCWPSCFTG